MKQNWKLWLDDQIHDPETPARHAPDGFIGAANFMEAFLLVLEKGPPVFMDLDHDLGEVNGEPDTAMSFLRWLADNHTEEIPEYKVHSANPVGRENIISFMNSWKRAITEGVE